MCVRQVTWFQSPFHKRISENISVVSHQKDNFSEKLYFKTRVNRQASSCVLELETF